MSQTPNVHVPAERRPLSFADSARSTTSRLRDPLPGSVLDALDAKARQRHAKLAKAATDLGAERRRLAEAVAKAPHADAEATSAAMLAGKPAPEPTEATLRDELAEAERLEAAAGEALRRSATALLNEAAPKLADVDAALTARALEDVDAIRGELDALREHVTALGRTFAEAGWIASAIYAGGRGVPAYSEQASGVGRTLRALSTVAEVSLRKCASAASASHRRRRGASTNASKPSVSGATGGSAKPPSASGASKRPRRPPSKRRAAFGKGASQYERAGLDRRGNRRRRRSAHA
jgi:hypothetical protein